MNSHNDSSSLSRRDALKRVFCGTLAASTFPHVLAREESSPRQSSEAAEFKPDNDYPFFGCKPPDAGS